MRNTSWHLQIQKISTNLAILELVEKSLMKSKTLEFVKRQKNKRNGTSDKQDRERYYARCQAKKSSIKGYSTI